MRLLIGLGNPGETYTHTRHNAGFLVTSQFASRCESQFRSSKKTHARIARCPMQELIIVQPETFMNASGTSVANAVKFYKVAIPDILVVHDDLDIDFGRCKFSFGSSAAGHNGVQSIIDALGTKDFWRLRVGIASPHRGSIPGETFVLQPFSESEQRWLEQTKNLMEALSLFFERGPEAAMQKFNSNGDAETAVIAAV